jgi:hypothetical protein
MGQYYFDRSDLEKAYHRIFCRHHTTKRLGNTAAIVELLDEVEAALQPTTRYWRGCVSTASRTTVSPAGFKNPLSM